MPIAKLSLLVALAALAACHASSSSAEDTPRTCEPETLDSYCAQVDCAVYAKRKSCRTDSTESITEDRCGSYIVTTTNNVDWSETRWFDAASGKLVAIGTNGVSNGGSSCLTADPSFVEPTGCSSTELPLCSDWAPGFVAKDGG